MPRKQDRFEDMTKEGCGRVHIYNMTNIIHSYTLECGFHQPNQLNYLAEPINQDVEFLGK